MSRFSQYVGRSFQLMRDGTSRVLRMAGTDEPCRGPMSILTFNSQNDLNNCVVGCDADMGGTSTVKFELSDEPHPQTGQRYARFHGDMRLGVKSTFEGSLKRGGYAGFRSQPRPALFGELFHNLAHHEFLGFKVKAGGDIKMRHSYFVNIQTDSLVKTDLWQHRLFFAREEDEWEDVYIPLNSFILMNSGEIVESEVPLKVEAEKIRTIGISHLGGHSNVEGPYELGIDSIWGINRSDIPDTGTS